jgi:hypothetical protein
VSAALYQRPDLEVRFGAPACSRPPRTGADHRIRARGRLGETIRCAFPALRAQASGGDTVLTGPLCDQATLHGVLAELEALGLELLEVRRLPPI